MSKIILAAALSLLSTASLRAEEPAGWPPSVVGVPVNTPAPGAAPAVPGLRYRQAAFSCADGHRRRVGSETSCKTEQDWVNFAEAICAKRCDNQRRKCGLNGLVVSEPCP